MHSYEERVRAVAFYIQLGKRLRATIRELGYPAKNTLIGWYREYERRQDLPIGSAPRPPIFPETQKQVALEHYASHGHCISWTMRALGYPGRTTLTAWVRAAFPETDLPPVGPSVTTRVCWFEIGSQADPFSCGPMLMH